MTQQESQSGAAGQVPPQNLSQYDSRQSGQMPPRPPYEVDRGGGLATFGTIFAGVILILVGLLQVAMGIAAIVGGRFYVTTNSNLFEFSLAGWGWLHLILGILLLIIGIGVLTGREWAFLPAIVFATFSAIENFLFLPHYPIWSIVVIALDILIIWSLARRMSAVAQYAVAERWQEQARTPPAGLQQDIASKLAKLGEMAQQGLLSTEEFARAKAKLLG